MNFSNRRHFLAKSAFSLAPLGLGSLFANEKPVLAPQTWDLSPKDPPKSPKAKAMISIFCGGGPSQMDLFDDKPLLRKYAGQSFPGKSELKFDNRGGASSIVMPTNWEFSHAGECGMHINQQLLPHFSKIADDVTLIRSMHLPNIRNHVAGMRAMTTGHGPDGWPSLGSWLVYGLGSETENLPAFVALVLRKNPPGAPYWDNKHLPSIYQGTIVRETQPRIANLEPAAHLRGKAQENQLGLLNELNQRHLAARPGENDLAARIASYELAARMQTSASEALDLSGESEATHALYGTKDAATKRMAEACLLARRLVERGVRMVQIWDYSWDMHADIFKYLTERCPSTDKPSAALVTDLKSRGLLDSTIVQWGGEMGRLPVVQSQGKVKKPGRDHNTEGFSIWMAGGGVKAGHVHGATDEFGHQAIEGVVTQHDFHATLLHLLGLDPEQLSFEHGTGKVALVEPGQGRVVDGILA